MYANNVYAEYASQLRGKALRVEVALQEKIGRINDIEANYSGDELITMQELVYPKLDLALQNAIDTVIDLAAIDLILNSIPEE